VVPAIGVVVDLSPSDPTACGWSVAPMIDRTDQHFRALVRIVAPRVRLYSEMAVATGSLHRLVRGEGPAQVAAQLAGTEPAAVVAAARVAADRGFDEINLNCGCPGPAALAGGYGAAAMRSPEAVADVVAALTSALALPVSVKCRISIHPERDQDDQLAELNAFVERVKAAGCRHFIVHARAAHLHGLSPRANRSVPPLSPHLVYAIADAHPSCRVEINGGVQTLAEGRAHRECSAVAAVMIGRAAYDDPLMLAGVDTPGRPRRAVLEETVEAMARYIDAQRDHGVAPWAVIRHMLGLPRGLPGGKRARQRLGALCHDASASGQAMAAAFREPLSPDAPKTGTSSRLEASSRPRQSSQP